MDTHFFVYKRKPIKYISTMIKTETASEAKGTTMKKELTVGKDYGCIFGLDSEKGQSLTYDGGNKWTARKPGAEQVIDSADTTAKAVAYINQSVVTMGKLA